MVAAVRRLADYVVSFSASARAATGTRRQGFRTSLALCRARFQAIGPRVVTGGDQEGNHGSRPESAQPDRWTHLQGTNRNTAQPTQARLRRSAEAAVSFSGRGGQDSARLRNRVGPDTGETR